MGYIILMPTGDFYYSGNSAALSNNWNNLVTVTSSTTGPSMYGNTWTYMSPTPVPKPDPVISLDALQEHITSVVQELKDINQRYNIFDPNLKNCEVLASKMLFNLLNKGTSEFGVSSTINGKRNVFLIIQTYELTSASNVVDTVVDVCAFQHGGVSIQLYNDNLTSPWAAEFRYKNPASLIKRLIKEGRPLKELSLKDAIALSTRYTVSGISPSQMDLHVINPGDTDGRKFLEKYSKEVGFRTTLAQLLLDPDPIVAEKARIIAQLILQR